MKAALHRIIFITFVASVAALPATNYTRAANSNCPSAGLFCLDCETLAVCVDIGGQLKPYTSKTCNQEIGYCSQSLKTCSGKNSYCYDDLQRKFLCQGSGIFPDPYDCNVYHDCRTPLDPNAEDWSPTATYVCGAGTAYNYATGVCDLPDTHDSCQENNFPVPYLCGADLAGAPLPLNANYYWMCVAFTLRVFKCEEGYIFNGSLYKCVADGEEAEEPTTTLPPNSQLCPDTGRQPDPEDCGRYFDCSDPVNPIRHSCSLGKYFHRRKQKCKLGFCPY